MATFSEIAALLSGTPATAGLILTALTIFVTSDWRLSLTALLVQYVMVGLVLARFIQSEVALVNALVGVMAVPILYLTARRLQELMPSQEKAKSQSRFLGLPVGWSAGPLGLPLRLLVVLLVALASLRLLASFRPPLVPPDIALLAFWMGSMGLVGLVLSSEPLRAAPALLTILAGFDLVYVALEPNLAIVGFYSALTLLAALALSYLAAVQGLGTGPSGSDQEEPAT
jgi:hypothetical protein